MKKYILVIGDDKDIRVEERIRLVGAGFLVVTASTSEDAFSVLYNVPAPAAIILGGENGFEKNREFRRVLSSRIEFALIPVIQVKEKGEEDIPGCCRYILRSDISRTIAQELDEQSQMS
ncbi:hypothetical protein [Bdellovibrio sp. HCB337]|uniref:hypothetical protein n=1 Tax=Bdellovibrio sp. HCB337 TaxID=3394358 RepID=UPI0039A683E9